MRKYIYGRTKINKPRTAVEISISFVSGKKPTIHVSSKCTQLEKLFGVAFFKKTSEKSRGKINSTKFEHRADFLECK